MRFYIFVWITFVCSGVAFANDTAFGGNAIAPMPMKTSNVSMVYEKIVLKTDPARSAWIVDCYFEFENTSDKSESFDMGFPFPKVDEEMVALVNTPSGKKVPPLGKPLVWEFKTWIDGKFVKSKMKAPSVNPKYPELEYATAYIWPITFKPKQKRIVKNRYVIGYTESSSGEMYVGYVLRTGAMWGKGKIGRSIVEVHMTDPQYIPGQRKDLKPSTGYKIKKSSIGATVYVWDRRNFAPSKDIEAGFRSRGYLSIMKSFELDAKLDKMNKAELRIARNTMAAMHGYRFKDQKLQAHFEKEPWYFPNPKFKMSDLPDEAHDFIKRVKQKENQN